MNHYDLQASKHLDLYEPWCWFGCTKTCHRKIMRSFLPSQDTNWHTFHTPAPEPLPWTTAGDCMCPEFSMFMAFFISGRPYNWLSSFLGACRSGFQDWKKAGSASPFFSLPNILHGKEISSDTCEAGFLKCWVCGSWPLVSSLIYVGCRVEWAFPIRFLFNLFSV